MIMLVTTVFILGPNACYLCLCFFMPVSAILIKSLHGGDCFPYNESMVMLATTVFILSTNACYL